MAAGMITDLEAIIVQTLNLPPRHIPVLALAETIGVRNIERAAKTMLLEDRGGDRRVAKAAVVKSEHHGLVRDWLLDDPRGVVGRQRFRPPNGRASNQHGTNRPRSYFTDHGVTFAFR